MVSGQAEEDDDIGISDSQAAMLETKIDPVEWKRELERVGPRLKVPVSTKVGILQSGTTTNFTRETGHEPSKNKTQHVTYYFIYEAREV